jgi:hypothetical protein
MELLGPKHVKEFFEIKVPIILHLLCFNCGDKIEKNKMGGACSAYGERGGLYRLLVGKPEGQ